MTTKEYVKKEIIKDFRNGITTSFLMAKYGFSRSTIND